MDRAHDCLVALAGKALQAPDDTNSGETIQAGGWLVEQHDLRIGDELDTNSCTLALTT